MKWGDDEIDNLFQQRTDDLSFEYKNEYWKEFEASLPVSGVVESAPEESVNDIDALYREKSNSLSFEFKSSYWDEMAAMLPTNKKRLDFLWFFTSFVFVGLISSMFFMNIPVIVENDTNYSAENLNIQHETNKKSSGIVERSIGESNVKVENNSSNQAKPTSQNELNGSSFENSASSTDITSNRVATPYISSNTNNLGVNSSQENDNSAPIDSENDSQITEAEFSHTAIASTASEQEIILETKKLEMGTIDRELAPSIFKNVKVPLKTNLYIELNGGISQALTSPSESTTSSLGIGIGTSFQKGRFIFTTGVNAIMSNHSDMSLSREAKVYGFGSELYRYNLEYKQTYSLEGAFTVGYILGRHTISLGCRPSYMINSRVIINQEGPEGFERNDVYGFMDGLNRFGIKPMIGYSINLSHGLVLGINVGAQLVQTVNEEFVNGKNSQLPIDGQLYLRKLIKFRK
jgi:hypothetical protein